MLYGVSSGRATSTNIRWRQREKFTTGMDVDPFLEAIKDKILVLQVFGRRVRIGQLAANKNSIKSRSVEDYLRSIGQTFLNVGKQDPRLNSSGNLDFRLHRMLACKPVPVSVPS